MATATASTTLQLCKPFVRSGFIDTTDGSAPIQLRSILQDSGAQGSNFLARHVYDLLPVDLKLLSRPTNRIVRLGDSRSLFVHQEVPLTISILDSKGQCHSHPLWYSVLDVLSHEVIIGLVDLIGPYYDLFEDSIIASRKLALTTLLSNDLDSLTDQVNSFCQLTQQSAPSITENTQCFDLKQATTHSEHIYRLRKQSICSSSDTSIHLLALQDGSNAETLLHPSHGTVFSDNRVENRYQLLASALIQLVPGQIVPPWSKPIDATAPEELSTPDPTSFPDDILTYLTTTHDEARRIYYDDLRTHVTPGILEACPAIMDLLMSDLALTVFVPQSWQGIKMEPLHLDVKPGLPAFLKARARPVREALYKDAKAEFDRMKTYFYEPSTSTIASPLVVAPKATAPYIRLCGDYRQINGYINIPQEPIPHVQQTLSKAAGWKYFVDLDMTNSFHQILLSHTTSLLLSVSTPWGLFRPKFLPEGVGPASGVLQSLVRRVFADFEDWTIVIFDNFLILASSYQDATDKLSLVLTRCHEYRLVLKMKKSWIGTDVVNFFGYEVKPGSWSLSQSRKDSIGAMIFPTTQKQMQSFLGAANFFHSHIPNYASWSSALYECTKTGFNWSPTSWSHDYQQLFDIFKTAIQNAVTLYFPDYALPWIIRSDSSDHAVGAVLFQEYTSSSGSIVHQPIAFASHKYSGAAVNWDTYKQEAYGLYFAVTQFGYYVRGKEFILETDHRNLLWMESSQVPIVIRWRVLLQSYNFKVKHIPGLQNTVADWLSRMYPINLVNNLQSAITEVYPPLSEMFATVHGKRSLHHGAKRTYLLLCQRYPGHGIPIRVIQDLVAECPLCQKDRIPIAIVPHSNVAETLMHHHRTIGIDHVTVTPHDEDGYVGLLLIVEHDTKFPFAYPVRDYTAVTVATILFKHYCTFGCFRAVISDPGSALTADVVANLNKWLGIPHHISLIGRHESNGTEHVNALFMGHLRRLVHDERLVHKWASDTVLPLINHAMATMPNSELGGLSPAALKFGTLDIPHFDLPKPLTPGHTYCDFVTRLDNNLATVRSITHTYQESIRKARQSLSSVTNSYQKGDLVLWNPKEHPHSFRSSKLAPKLLGPYEVLSQSKNDVLCVHPIAQTSHLLHSSRLTPFIGSVEAAKDLGLLDKEEYIVEQIITHRGKPPRLKTLQFLVRWAGYDSTSDTWESWATLRNNLKLHAYLAATNLSSLIPRQFRIV